MKNKIKEHEKQRFETKNNKKKKRGKMLKESKEILRRFKRLACNFFPVSFIKNNLLYLGVNYYFLILKNKIIQVKLI